jgi:hypothetical protein
VGDLQPIFAIGPMIWRCWGLTDHWNLPFDEWDPAMIEPWYVDRLTPQKVFIRSFIDPENPPHRSFEISRHMLQKHGWAVARGISNGAGEIKGGMFLVRRPEAYRKKTIGYAVRGEAKTVLGLTADATESDVRDAYLRLIKQHHPDRPGGDQETFIRVQEAYESLGKPVSIEAIIGFMRREPNG